MLSGNKIQIIRGDITAVQSDAIVNAANTSLMGGSGVDGAIHKAGGSAILEECRKIIARQGGCKTGEAVITTAGKLPAKYVIHTVGCFWNEGKHDEEKLLAACYQNSLELAFKYGCKTIAFPNISTGIYRFPKDLAARISLEVILNFLAFAETMDSIILVCYDLENYTILTNSFNSRNNNEV